MQRIPLLQIPGEFAAVRRLNVRQIPEIVGVAEFAKNPGTRRTPIAAEVVYQRLEILQIAVEVIVVEIGKVELAAISLARAAVIAEQHAPHLVADTHV